MESDFIRLHMEMGTPNIPIIKLGFSWPPPEYIHMRVPEGFKELTEEGLAELDPNERKFVFVRTNYSSITDEEIADMTHVIRGAEYHYLGADDGD